MSCLLNKHMIAHNYYGYNSFSPFHKMLRIINRNFKKQDQGTANTVP